MKIKTSELIGNALNWAVEMAECEGAMYSGRECRPFSTDWAQGGPIIERERMTTEFLRWDEVDGALPVWLAAKPVRGFVYESEGNSPLIAAMRCYVGTKLGNEVDVPEVCLNDK